MKQLITLIYAICALGLLYVLWHVLCYLGVPGMLSYLFLTPLDYFPTISINSPKKGFGATYSDDSL